MFIVEADGEGDVVPRLKEQPAVSTATTMIAATSNSAVFFIIIIACTVIVNLSISFYDMNQERTISTARSICWGSL